MGDTLKDAGRRMVEDNAKSRRESFESGHTGTYSLVKATFEAELSQRGRSGPVPRLEGPVEIRVQANVLRIAGRIREGIRWKDDRVKLAYPDVRHARARDSIVDLWVRDGEALQAVSLQLTSRQAAKELVTFLPDSTPPPPHIAAGRGSFPYGMVIGISAAVLGLVAVVLVLFGTRLR